MLSLDNIGPDFPIPVLVLDHSGKVLRANQAANRMITLRPGLQARLQCALRAHFDNPAWNSAQDSPTSKQEQDLDQVWITPVTEGYVALFSSDDGMAMTMRQLPVGSTQDIAYSSLINQEVLRELDALAEQLSLCEGQSAQQRPAIADRIQYVRHLLSTIERLASTQQHAANFTLGEIVDLNDLLQEILQQQPSLQASIEPLIPTHDIASSMGTLFARREWLKAALLTLLLHQNTSRQAIPPLRLTIEHQDGFLAIHCTPVQGKQNTSITTDGPDTPLTHRTNIDLALARHIIELHGGQLEMPDPQAAQGRAGGFRVTLPTGTPPHGYASHACQQCIYAGLAKTFAKDLGRLLPRKPLHLRVSPEELQLLEQLHQSLSLNTDTYKEQSP
jgi:hypothetical protein